MLDVLLRSEHLCTGLPRQQMCGRISLWANRGLCQEMQQQGGKRFILTFKFSIWLLWTKVPLRWLMSGFILLHFVFRCVTTRKSATVILAGRHPTVTSSMQIYLKVQDASRKWFYDRKQSPTFWGGLVALGQLSVSSTELKTGHTCWLNHSSS